MANLIDKVRRFVAEDVPAWVARMSPARGFRTYKIGNAMLAGLNTPEDALKIAAVWRCVSLVSQSGAMLPWNVYRRKANGDGERVANHPVEWLLHNQANEEMSAYDFRRTMWSHAMTWGNGYAEIVRDTANRPRAMYLLDPSRVTPGRDAEGKLVYRVTQQDGSAILLPARSMYHKRGLGFDGVTGYSVLEVAAGSLSSAMQLDNTLGDFFARGFRPMGFLKTKGKLSLEGLKALEAKIDEHSGPSKRWRAVPLDQDMEWQALSMSPEDAQLIDMRKFSVLDICRWFGVPPHMAFDLDRATFSNIEAQGRDFLTYALMPWIVGDEQEADMKLLSSQFGGLYSKVTVDAIVRADIDKRWAAYKTALDSGVFTINEVRALEEKAGIGPKGDEHVRQVQYQPIGTEMPATPVGAPPNEPQQEPPAPKPNGAANHLNGAH